MFCKKIEVDTGGIMKKCDIMAFNGLTAIGYTIISEFRDSGVSTVFDWVKTKICGGGNSYVAGRQ